jgi:hypothetical protein
MVAGIHGRMSGRVVRLFEYVMVVVITGDA